MFNYERIAFLHVHEHEVESQTGGVGLSRISHLVHSRKIVAGISGGALVAVILLVVLFVGMRGGPVPQEPNVQVTDINMLQIILEHPPETVIGAPRVSNSLIFDYNATYAGPGLYSLLFNNRYSSTTENISLSYVAAGKSFAYIEILPVGAGISISHDLSNNQRINGQFTLTGGSPNDISFNLTARTCSHTISFNFTLVNTGTANGNATVSLQSDGTSYWQHTYLVAQGKTLPESGYLTLPDCTAHNYNLEVTALKKT